MIQPIGNRFWELFRCRLCWNAIVVLMLPSIVWAADGTKSVDNTPDATATTLLVIGVILLMLEVKIVSQGILGFFGALALIGATTIIWRDDASFWGIPVVYVVPLIILILILGIWLAVLAAQAYNSRVVTGYEGFIGDEATASVSLKPEGQVFYQGAYWQAIAISPIEKNEKVRILSVKNMKLTVEPWSNESFHPSKFGEDVESAG